MKTHSFPTCAFTRFTSIVVFAVAALGPILQARAAAPLTIGVLAPTAITPGKALVNGAELAAADINASGGVNGQPIKLVVLNTNLSSSDAVNAMKRAVLQDHAVAIDGVFATEIALPLMPYANRLNVPLIVAAGSTAITKQVHDHYAQYKNVFQLAFNSRYIAEMGCNAAHDLLVNGHARKVSAVILSEQADWTRSLDRTYQACLPKAGITVKKLITYADNTSDFSPIYNEIDSLNPTIIMVGMAHTGLIPVIQWHRDRVPSLMFGFNIQAGTSEFWKASNGAAQGTVQTTIGAGGAAVTPKTPAFYHAYVKKYGKDPMLLAYLSYDATYALADAIKKAGNAATAGVVKALEATNMVGVSGRIQFYGPDATFTHLSKLGPGFVNGVAFQWQDGKQVVVWPKALAQGTLVYPAFVHH